MEEREREWKREKLRNREEEAASRFLIFSCFGNQTLEREREGTCVLEFFFFFSSGK